MRRGFFDLKQCAYELRTGFITELRCLTLDLHHHCCKVGELGAGIVDTGVDRSEIFGEAILLLRDLPFSECNAVARFDGRLANPADLGT